MRRWGGGEGGLGRPKRSKVNGKAYVQQCRALAGQGSADVLMVEWLEQLRHHFFLHTPKALLRGKKVKEARKLVPRQISVLVCA